jgi:ribosomal protein S6--L-glutamate ligase
MTRYGCAVVRQFEMQGAYTVSSSVAITRSRDKLRAAQILAKYDVDTPKTLVSRNTSDIDDLLEQIGLPVIIKLARGTHGNGVILADTRKAAKSALQAFYLYNEDGTNIFMLISSISVSAVLVIALILIAVRRFLVYWKKRKARKASVNAVKKNKTK